MANLIIETSSEEKAAWVRAAQTSPAFAGSGLANWAIETLNKAAAEALMKTRNPSHLTYIKRIQQFIDQKFEREEIKHLSHVRAVHGPTHTELLGYQVQLVRKTVPVNVGRSDINVNDPLADELMEISREYGVMEYLHTKPDGRGEVSTFFLDPYAAPFRFYRVRMKGEREYISNAPSTDLSTASWTDSKAHAATFTRIGFAMMKSMIERLRELPDANLYEYGREYI